MFKQKFLLKCFLTSAIVSVATMAEITIDRSDGVLTFTSETGGMVVAKIIDPKGKIIVDKRYRGNSFVWAPEADANGAYLYDVRIFPIVSQEEFYQKSKTKGDYAGGSIEVVNGTF